RKFIDSLHRSRPYPLRGYPDCFAVQTCQIVIEAKVGECTADHNKNRRCPILEATHPEVAEIYHRPGKWKFTHEVIVYADSRWHLDFELSVPKINAPIEQQF